MNEFKDFQGKSLDEAIESACKHFNLERGKLEIEIVSGGSTGIFGLMGVKKAEVQARPRPDTATGREREGAGRKASAPAEAPTETPAKKQASPAAPAPAPSAAPNANANPDDDFDDELQPAFLALDPEDDFDENNEPNGNIAPPDDPYERESIAIKFAASQTGNKRPQAPRQPRRQHQKSEPSAKAAPQDAPDAEEEYVGPDPQLVEDTVREILTHLLKPIVENPKLDFTREAGRFDVFIDDEENSGLIIGREGQTLSALQYLVNRMVSRKLDAPVRIQIDTGDYRERQNEGLRRLALQLADKAKNFGRPQSTRPLSSYHRRVVHMALQNDGQVQTRSKGDGPLKKVLILPKRGRGPAPRRPREPREQRY